jgi:DUF971 family protein
MPTPTHLDLQRDTALTITWDDGSTVIYPIAHLRRNSPSAETKAFHEEKARNPLTVIPDKFIAAGPLTIVNADLVGNYAIRLHFSDGHSSGIFSWEYLWHIRPGA